MTLPKDPALRAEALVQRSLPDPDQAPPGAVSPAVYRETTTARNLRAATYAGMEDLADQCRQMAEDIDASGIVVDLIDPDDEDSLVRSMVDLEDSLDDYPTLKTFRVVPLAG